MRFLCIYKPGMPESDAPPSQEEMAVMGKLIDEMSKAGVLLATEGGLPSSLEIDWGRIASARRRSPATRASPSAFSRARRSAMGELRAARAAPGLSRFALCAAAPATPRGPRPRAA